MSQSDYLSKLNDEDLLKNIEYFKDRINHLEIQLKTNSSAPILINFKIDIYTDEIHDFEEEINRRRQQLTFCKNRLYKSVTREKSRKAVRNLLTKPHYSQLPNIPIRHNGWSRFLSPQLGRTKTESMLSSLAGESGIARSILNYLTGEDRLPTNDRVYLRVLQNKLNDLPEEVLLKIWNNLSNRNRLSNIREDSSDSDEPMPETGGRRRRRNKTKRNKTKRNKTKRNKTKRNKTIK